MSNKENITELSEDIEVIGPGQMLADARVKAGLSQADVATRLNFRETLVDDIENERFDKAISATYNRGYLKSYAKLVKVSETEVLNSYEMLGIAQTQCAEMQSFSKITEKQTHNNILMWITYLIIALLIGSSAMWWLQGDQGISLLDSTASITSDNVNKPVEISSDAVNQAVKVTPPITDTKDKPMQTESIDNSEQLLEVSVNTDKPSVSEVSVNTDKPSVSEVAATQDVNINAQDLITETHQPRIEKTTENSSEIATSLSSAIFTFSGDCWVNIYDATGERIAWGVKKSGYEMSISGVAPLAITLGKPELVNIIFEGEAIDTSLFAKGNIAKFTLPLKKSQ